MNVKLVFDIDCIYEGALVRLLNLFMKNSASAVFKAWFAYKHKALTRMPSVTKTSALSKNPQLLNYILYTYATIENIAATEDEITMLSQPPNRTSSR